MKFPERPTLYVGASVLVLSAGMAAAVLHCLDPASLRDAWLAMAAAGVGGCITAVGAYLRHASEEGDFDPAFGAWYIGRPVLAVLLGLVLFLLDRWAGESDPWFLASVSALAGLFSKEAVVRLHAVFQAIFPTPTERSK